MDLLKSANDDNVTMKFHEACLRGDLDEITNLLQRKEDIHVKQLDKNHTLESTVKNGYLEIVKILLKIGVNVNQKESLMGIRPLHCACAIEGNLAIAEILLENGADIDAILKVIYRSPLHVAVSKRNTSIVKLLWKNGCKTHVRDFEGMTALEMAMKEHYIDVVKLFAFHNK